MLAEFSGSGTAQQKRDILLRFHHIRNSCLSGSCSCPSPSITASAHPGRGGGVTKPCQLLTNLMPSGIFHYAMITGTLICKMWECLDLVAAEKNTFLCPPVSDLERVFSLHFKLCSSLCSCFLGHGFLAPGSRRSSPSPAAWSLSLWHVPFVPHTAEVRNNTSWGAERSEAVDGHHGAVGR